MTTLAIYSAVLFLAWSIIELTKLRIEIKAIQARLAGADSPHIGNARERNECIAKLQRLGVLPGSPC